MFTLRGQAQKQQVLNDSKEHFQVDALNTTVANSELTVGSQFGEDIFQFFIRFRHLVQVSCI